jgi:hypothetical protein
VEQVGDQSHTFGAYHEAEKADYILGRGEYASSATEFEGIRQEVKAWIDAARPLEERDETA